MRIWIAAKLSNPIPWYNNYRASFIPHWYPIASPQFDVPARPSFKYNVCDSYSSIPQAVVTILIFHRIGMCQRHIPSRPPTARPQRANAQTRPTTIKKWTPQECLYPSKDQLRGKYVSAGVSLLSLVRWHCDIIVWRSQKSQTLHADPWTLFHRIIASGQKVYIMASSRRKGFPHYKHSLFFFFLEKQKYTRSDFKSSTLVSTY